MRRKKAFFIIISCAVCLLIGMTFAYGWHNEWVRRGLEYTANLSGREFFGGSIRLDSVQVKPDFKLSVRQAKGKLKTKKGWAPMEIQSIESVDPLTNYLFGKPVRFVLRGVRVQNSPYEGIEGTAVSRVGKNWSFELDAKIQSFGLEDLEWFDPENLAGSSGRMTGSLRIKNDYTEKPEFRVELTVKEPGGNIQAQFFDLLAPYLPQFEGIRKIQTLTGDKRLVTYKNANLNMEITDPDKLKVFLHILVPAYNLNLNINMEIRTDQENAFMELARVMGLIEVKLS